MRLKPGTVSSGKLPNDSIRVVDGDRTLAACGKMMSVIGPLEALIYYRAVGENMPIYTRATVAASPYTAVASANTTIDLLCVDSSGGPITINLPPAASVSVGKAFTIKDETGDAYSNNITIDPNGAETIDESLTYVLNRALQSVTIYSNGVNWMTLDADTVLSYEVLIDGDSATHNSNTALVLGAFYLNPTQLGYLSNHHQFVFEAAAVNGETPRTNHVALVNMTAGGTVSDLNVTSTTTAQLTSTPTVAAGAGNINTGLALYEVRLYLGAASTGATDTVTAYSWMLKLQFI